MKILTKALLLVVCSSSSLWSMEREEERINISQAIIQPLSTQVDTAFADSSVPGIREKCDKRKECAFTYHSSMLGYNPLGNLPHEAILFYQCLGPRGKFRSLHLKRLVEGEETFLECPGKPSFWTNTTFRFWGK